MVPIVLSKSFFSIQCYSCNHPVVFCDSGIPKIQYLHFLVGRIRAGDDWTNPCQQSLQRGLCRGSRYDLPILPCTDISQRSATGGTQWHHHVTSVRMGGHAAMGWSGVEWWHPFRFWHTGSELTHNRTHTSACWMCASFVFLSGKNAHRSNRSSTSLCYSDM